MKKPVLIFVVANLITAGHGLAQVTFEPPATPAQIQAVRALGAIDIVGTLSE